MKNIRAASLSVSCAGLWLALYACALVTAPVAAEVIQGAGLAIQGEKLRKEIKKADAQAALDRSFDSTWNASVAALADLDIEIVRGGRNLKKDGGSIEGLAGKTKIRVVLARLTEKITEIGIWADHDKALARFIAEKIKEKANEAE